VLALADLLALGLDVGLDLGVLDTYKTKSDAQSPAPSVFDLFADEMPADLYAMALRSHPLSAQGIHLLYFTRLLMGGGHHDVCAIGLALKLNAFGIKAHAQGDSVFIEAPHMAGAQLVRRGKGSVWCWTARPTLPSTDLAARLLDAEWTVQPCEVL